MQGEASAGVVLLRQGLASPAVGPESLRPYWLALLAEAYGREGKPQAGLQVLAEAVTLMTTTEIVNAASQPLCRFTQEGVIC
jgi:hypothetical protein